MGIAVIHTTFNIITTALLLPLRNVLEKLAYMTIRVDDEEKALMERQSVNEFALLDDRFLESPSLAVEHCKTVIGNMADISRSHYLQHLDLSVIMMRIRHCMLVSLRAGLINMKMSLVHIL